MLGILRQLPPHVDMGCAGRIHRIELRLSAEDFRQLTPAMLEMFGDQAEEFLSKKDSALLKTRFQRISKGVGEVVKKRVGKEIVETAADEVKLVWTMATDDDAASEG